MSRRAAGVVAGVVAAAIALPASAQANRDGEHVTTITDERIAESSGLAVSPTDPSLLYTINDSDNAASVYAIDRASGDVVGVTTLSGYSLADTEALGLGSDGTMWVADIGDNAAARTDIALYAFPEPGRGDSTVTPRRYPLRYRNGPQDAETLLVGPESQQILVVSKGLVSGTAYRAPAHLRADRPNVLRPVRKAQVPGIVTDGSFTPDGDRIVLRTYGNAVAYDSKTWKETWSTELPAQRQGESLAVEPDGRSFLVGTEGLPSQILRIDLPEPTDATPKSERHNASDDQSDEQSQLDLGVRILVGLGVVLVLLVGCLVIAARRSRAR
ncbi:hypothetical protein [Solicola gregarius]|uniref:Esterase-like activity of phytase family protein n=1 Tax=Solicola gregarius TaxID=2908642 RepID=A0AA46TJW2_9ACTN|nr:hypothetical protein [Solicola gregarius]UYM06699.1 esterase-like activity of phytase family protein [Solicola gregarius]